MQPVLLDEIAPPSIQHTHIVVAFNSRPQPLARRIKMSQVGTIANSEVSSAIIGAENANPNAESAILLKVKDATEENLICSENLRSESSTPVKEIVEEQPAAESQPAGIFISAHFSIDF